MIYVYYIGAALMLPVYIALVVIAGRMISQYFTQEK